jgi:hypothetical protein
MRSTKKDPLKKCWGGGGGILNFKIFNFLPDKKIGWAMILYTDMFGVEICTDFNFPPHFFYPMNLHLFTIVQKFQPPFIPLCLQF